MADHDGVAHATGQAGDGRQQMQKQDGQIAHRTILARSRIPRNAHESAIRHAQAERAAVYANRRRIRSDRGQQLLRTRGELLERPCAHLYETGGLRLMHMRGHINVLKRSVTSRLAVARTSRSVHAMSGRRPERSCCLVVAI